VKLNNNSKDFRPYNRADSSHDRAGKLLTGGMKKAASDSSPLSFFFRDNLHQPQTKYYISALKELFRLTGDKNYY